MINGARKLSDNVFFASSPEGFAKTHRSTSQLNIPLKIEIFVDKNKSHICSSSKHTNFKGMIIINVINVREYEWIKNYSPYIFLLLFIYKFYILIFKIYFWIIFVS